MVELGIGWGHIVPVEEPGFSVAVAAFLDTDPCRSQRAGLQSGLLPSSIVDPHTVLGSHLVRGTPTRPANVEILHLAEPAFRRGRSRFTGNAAGYYFRPVREISVGEPFVVDCEPFVSANVWGSVEPATHALHSPLGFVSGLLTFRRDVVLPSLPIVDGLSALAGATVGAIAAGPSSDGLGGRGSCSAGPSPARAFSVERALSPLIYIFSFPFNFILYSESLFSWCSVFFT